MQIYFHVLIFLKKYKNVRNKLKLRSIKISCKKKKATRVLAARRLALWITLDHQNESDCFPNYFCQNWNLLAFQNSPWLTWYSTQNIQIIDSNVLWYICGYPPKSPRSMQSLVMGKFDLHIVLTPLGTIGAEAWARDWFVK